MKRVLLWVVILGWCSLYAQFTEMDETIYIGASTPTGDGCSEKVVMEARPMLKLYPINQTKMRNDQWVMHKAGMVFDTHIRMFNKVSRPVSMPSYKLYLTYAPMFDIPSERLQITPVIEHGHYSNGQDGCPFGLSKDESSECEEIYATLDTLDLSANLNRSSGEFSTNFFRFKVKFALKLGEHNSRLHMDHELHVSLGYTRYVQRVFGINAGGYDDKDARFYSLNRYHLEVANLHRIINNSAVYKLRYGTSFYYLPSNHKQITPFWGSAFCTYTWPSGVGLFVRAEHGQDQYNLRFVDTVTRMMAGAVFIM